MRLPAAVDDKYLKSSRALNAREYSMFRCSTFLRLFLFARSLSSLYSCRRRESTKRKELNLHWRAPTTHICYINSSTVTQLRLYHALSSSKLTINVPSISPLLFWVNERFQGARTTRVCTLRKLTRVWKAQKSVVSVFFSFLDFLTLISETKACAAHLQPAKRSDDEEEREVSTQNRTNNAREK